MKIKIDNTLEQNIQDILDSNGNSLISAIMLAAHPVGSIYMSVDNTNPGSIFGGTWVAWGSGQVPVGVKTTDTDFATVEKTGGSKTASTSYTPKGTNSGGSVGNHTLTAAESGVPAHNHGASSDTQGSHSHQVYLNGDGNFPLVGYPGWTGGSNHQGMNMQTTYNGFNVFTGNNGGHSHNITVNNNTAKGATNGHNHGFTNPTFTGTAATITESTVQPYITCYMFKRTA